MAFSVTENGTASVWIYDQRSERNTQLTTPKGNYLPMWTRDGRFLIVGGLGGLTWIRADGTGKAERLTHSGDIQVPWSISPDGNRLAYHQLSRATGYDLWTVPIHSSETGITAGKPEVFLQTAAYETYPSVSPDGKWIAYGSNESGSWEVYVRAFPDRGERVQVSADGGRIPFWSRNGRELLYRTDDQRIVAATYAIRGSSFLSKPGSNGRKVDSRILASSRIWTLHQMENRWCWHPQQMWTIGKPVIM